MNLYVNLFTTCFKLAKMNMYKKLMDSVGITQKSPIRHNRAFFMSYLYKSNGGKLLASFFILNFDIRQMSLYQSYNCRFDYIKNKLYKKFNIEIHGLHLLSYLDRLCCLR